jgi:hypothetical protein
VTDWLQGGYGAAALDDVHVLSFDELGAGMLNAGTEPIVERAGDTALAA